MRFVSIYLLVLVLMIPILGFFGYRSLQNIRQETKNIKLPDFETQKNDIMAGFDDMLENEQSAEEKETVFTDPYSRIKLKYGSAWTIANNNQPSDGANATSEELLLFGYKTNVIKMESAYFAVERLDISDHDSLLEMLAKDAQNKGQTMEIVSTSDDGKKKVIDASYIQKDNPDQSFRAKEAAVIDGDKTYFIVITASIGEWPTIEKEALAIIDSIEVMPQPEPSVIPLISSETP